jgi:hypothetical protein
MAGMEEEAQAGPAPALLPSEQAAALARLRGALDTAGAALRSDVQRRMRAQLDEVEAQMRRLQRCVARQCAITGAAAPELLGRPAPSSGGAQESDEEGAEHVDAEEEASGGVGGNGGAPGSAAHHGPCGELRRGPSGELGTRRRRWRRRRRRRRRRPCRSEGPRVAVPSPPSPLVSLGPGLPPHPPLLNAAPPPTPAVPAAEALLQRVFAVTDALSRLEAAGLASLARCGEDHVRQLFRRNKGALTALMARTGCQPNQQQGLEVGDSGAAPDGLGVGPAPSGGPRARGSDDAAGAAASGGADSPHGDNATTAGVRPRRLLAGGSGGTSAASAATAAVGSGAAAGQVAEAGGAAREQGLLKAHERDIARISNLLDGAAGGVADPANAPCLVAVLASLSGFASRRRALAALRATRGGEALRRLDSRRLADVLGQWAEEGEAEGHATFLAELLQVRSGTHGQACQGVPGVQYRADMPGRMGARRAAVGARAAAGPPRLC